jgi:hypothetical protein
MKAVTIDDTQLSFIDLPHARTYFRNYFGKAGVLLDGPQAYMIQMPDLDSYVPPHFHDIDQFQIALEGNGSFGKKSWPPGTFHYADAYGPYGPIIAGEGGISFLTLRVASSSGQYEMPGSRHLMPGHPGRSASGGFDVSEPVPPEGSPSVRGFITSRSDGMQAVGLRLAPNAREPGIPSDGGGQYYVVHSGSLLESGRVLPKYTLIFVDAGENAPVLQAGPEGAVLVMLQFPRPSGRPGSDPAQLASRDRNKEYVVAH